MWEDAANDLVDEFSVIVHDYEAVIADLEEAIKTGDMSAYIKLLEDVEGL